MFLPGVREIDCTCAPWSQEYGVTFTKPHDAASAREVDIFENPASRVELPRDHRR